MFKTGCASVGKLTCDNYTICQIFSKGIRGKYIFLAYPTRFPATFTCSGYFRLIPEDARQNRAIGADPNIS